MRLRSLEIKGFKSFADQTLINFEKDVIGIVGPNGCGKSNIVDAIRWVLGEQKTKELRSDKMSNVIFNGTKKRKESGLASVSLTFDNTRNILPTDFSTVAITRMLYRSGESEYLLNDIPCRLKDITNLFLDTGIGADSYAIIALGMVDDLLSDKENSRRRLFEQAAGVSKYKLRKRETLSKLEATTIDLARIEDLLFEIETNVKNLEKQAKRAKRFFEMKAEYKEASLDLVIHRLASYKVDYKEITKKIDAETDELGRLNASQAQLEAQLETEKKANLEQEKNLTERQRELNQTVGRIRGLENDKKVVEQKILFVQQSQQTLAQQIEQAETKIAQLKHEHTRFEGDIALEKQIEKKLEGELAETEKTLTHARTSHASMKSELDDFLRQQQQLDRALLELEKKKAIQQNQRENLHRDVVRLQSEMTARETETNTTIERAKNLDNQRKQKEENLENLRQAEEKRLNDIETAQKSLDALNEKLRTQNRTLDAQRNEFKLTKSLVENLEGFPESIKFLSKEKTWSQNVPLLSDLIYTPEAYRVAIENYLEPYLNYYVVANIAEAAKAIQLLGNAQKGRANFFLLDAFEDDNAFATPSELLLATENSQLATKIVQVDEPYRKLCTFLLGGVIIVETDNPLAVEVPKGAVVLSKTGKFVRRNISITGGSVGLFEGKRIGRKKNLELLQQNIETLEKETDQLTQASYRAKDDIKNLQAADRKRIIQEENNLLTRLVQEAASLHAKIESFDAYMKDALRKKEDIENRVSILDLENQNFELELFAKKEEATTARKKIVEADDAFRHIADQLATISQTYNQKNVEFIRQQNKTANLQRELVFREKQLEETNTRLANDQQRAQSAESDMKQALDELSRVKQQLSEGYTHRKEKEQELSEVEQTYYRARNAAQALEDNIRQIIRKTNETQQTLNRLKDKFNDIKLELTAVGERLRAEFGMALNDIINNEPKENISHQDLEEKIEKMKKRLDAYGDINPMALEAYEEMKERFDTITAQRQDILSAKESLMETIKEIEGTAAQQFMSSFEQVRNHFKNVFRSLFSTEDECDLLLETPNDPLESRIKITAKPKGKRPQTIDQLSGGEKTLTATALLFSLYLLKPAPFCIFDEVDAPLDDANITKFNNIIKTFSKDSQFIIVTHNKQTMSAVDAIYGVTMQEQGVSSVVPVDFSNL